MGIIHESTHLQYALKFRQDSSAYLTDLRAGGRYTDTNRVEVAGINLAPSSRRSPFFAADGRRSLAGPGTLHVRFKALKDLERDFHFPPKYVKV